MKRIDVSNGVADRIWRERTGIAWKDDDRIADRPGEVPVDLHFPDGSSVRISTSPWRIKVEMGGHVSVMEYGTATPVITAWRAVRAEAMLRALGDLEDAERIAQTPVGAFARLRRRLGARPVRRLDNLHRRLDATLARLVREDATRPGHVRHVDYDYDGEKVTREALWRHATGGVRFVGRSRQTLEGVLKHVIVDHPDWGMVEIDGPETSRALESVRLRTFEAVLGGAAALPPPAAPPTGNARLARIIELCRQALGFDPDLADSSGTAIRPLVEQHLPRLLATHAEASRTSPADELAQVDAALDRGVDTIRSAVLDAVETLHKRRMRDLAVQLRFLEMRHPQAAETRRVMDS